MKRMENELIIKEVRPQVFLLDENHEATGYLVAILIGVGIIAMGVAYLVAFRGIHKFDKEVEKFNNNIKEMMQ